MTTPKVRDTTVTQCSPLDCAMQEVFGETPASKDAVDSYLECGCSNSTRKPFVIGDTLLGVALFAKRLHKASKAKDKALEAKYAAATEKAKVEAAKEMIASAVAERYPELSQASRNEITKEIFRNYWFLAVQSRENFENGIWPGGADQRIQAMAYGARLSSYGSTERDLVAFDNFNSLNGIDRDGIALEKGEVTMNGVRRFVDRAIILTKARIAENKSRYEIAVSQWQAAAERYKTANETGKAIDALKNKAQAQIKQIEEDLKFKKYFLTDSTAREAYLKLVRRYVNECSQTFIEQGDLYADLEQYEKAAEVYERATNPMRALIPETNKFPSNDIAGEAHLRAAEALEQVDRVLNKVKIGNHYRQATYNLMGADNPTFALKNPGVILNAAECAAKEGQYELAVQIADHVANFYDANEKPREYAIARLEGASYANKDPNAPRSASILRYHEASQAFERAEEKLLKDLAKESDPMERTAMEGIQQKLDQLKRIAKNNFVEAVFKDIQARVAAFVDPSHAIPADQRDIIVKSRSSEIMPTIEEIFDKTKLYERGTEYRRFKKEGGVEFALQRAHEKGATLSVDKTRFENPHSSYLPEWAKEKEARKGEVSGEPAMPRAVDAESGMPRATDASKGNAKGREIEVGQGKKGRARRGK